MPVPLVPFSPYWLFFLEQPFFYSNLVVISLTNEINTRQLNNETIEFPTVYISNTPVKSIIG